MVSRLTGNSCRSLSVAESRVVILSEEKLLEAVAKEVIVCVKCPLWKTRRNAVPGAGSVKSRLIFIGEAPGQSEDLKGEPFVGTAGKFLDELLSIAGFSRENVFITNVVKCRPPRNREPKPSEVETCTPYLNRQIQIIQPEFVVTLGNHSTAYVFSKTNLHFAGITRVHGKFYDSTLLGLKVTVFPTFHPAAALYSARYREELVNDFHGLRSELVKRGFV
jgi:uracil-DNA glycosylase family 4